MISSEQIIRHSIFAGFAFVVITIPLSSQLGVASLAALALFGSFYAVRKRYWDKPQLHIWFLIIAYFVRILWLVKSEDLSYGLKTLETEAPLIVVPFAFSLLDICYVERNRLLIIYTLTGLATILYSFLLAYLNYSSSHHSFLTYLKDHFANAQYNTEVNVLKWRLAHYNFISAFAVYGFSATLFLKREKKSELIIYAFYIVFVILFLIFTGSKAGLVMLSVALLIYILKKIKVRLNMTLIYSITLVLLFAIIISWTYYSRIDPARHMMVQIAGRAIKSKPLLGYGTGSGKEVMHNEDFEYHFTQTVNHPHNQYLSELIQFGLIGAIPFFLFFITGILYSVRKTDWQLFSILLLGSIFMLVESPLNSNKGILPFIILICLLSKSHSSVESHE